MKWLMAVMVAAAVLISMTGCNQESRAKSKPGTIGQVAPPKTFKSGGAVEGMWLGMLKALPQQGDLRVMFTIRTEADGSLSATCDSIDQGTRGIPVDETKVDGENISMSLKLIKGSFEGKHTAQNTIVGKWKQPGIDMPLTLEKVTQAPTVATPVPHAEVAVDPNTFEQYAGQYAITPQFSITVTKEGDQLMQQASGQGKYQIFPEGPDKFFLKVVDAQYTFTRDANGKVTGLVLHQNKLTLPGKKIR